MKIELSVHQGDFDCLRWILGEAMCEITRHGYQLADQPEAAANVKQVRDLIARMNRGRALRQKRGKAP
jgi:hypothetical protein